MSTNSVTTVTARLYTSVAPSTAITCPIHQNARDQLEGTGQLTLNIHNYPADDVSEPVTQSDAVRWSITRALDRSNSFNEDLNNHVVKVTQVADQLNTWSFKFNPCKNTDHCHPYIDIYGSGNLSFSLIETLGDRSPLAYRVSFPSATSITARDFLGLVAEKLSVPAYALNLRSNSSANPISCDNRSLHDLGVTLGWSSHPSMLSLSWDEGVRNVWELLYSPGVSLPVYLGDEHLSLACNETAFDRDPQGRRIVALNHVWDSERDAVTKMVSEKLGIPTSRVDLYKLPVTTALFGSRKVEHSIDHWKLFVTPKRAQEQKESKT